MKKKEATMIHANKNGADGIKISSYDPYSLQIIKDTLNEIGLNCKENTNNFYISKYNINQLYECVLKTKVLIDWKVSGGLIELFKNLMPVSTSPNCWSLNSVVELAQIKARPYQIAGINSIVRCPRKSFILNDDFGLGKTIESILAAKFFQKNLGKVCIICPSYLMRQWEEQIDLICPDLDYEIGNFNKKTDAKIVIVDEIHLAIGTKVKKSNAKNTCRKAEKVIALTGVDFDEKMEDFEELLKILGLGFSSRILRNHFSHGVKGLVLAISDLTPCYLRRTREQVELKTVKRTTFLNLDPKLKKIINQFKNQSQITVKDVDHLLEVTSILKVDDVLRQILDAKRLNRDWKIAVYSRFPLVLESINSRSKDSVVYDGQDTGHSVKLYLSSTYKDGLSLDCDELFILDPFMDSTSNIQVESRITNGIVTKLICKGGIDELVTNNSRYASSKRNLETVKNLLKDL